jgi:serine/threonine protein kinase
MILLPRDVGPLTLIKKIGSGGVSESFAGTIRHENGEKEDVVIRRVLPFIIEDLARLTSVEARVRDLIGVEHDGLIKTRQWLPIKNERFVIEDRLESVDLQRVISWCKEKKVKIPDAIFLNIASQICTSLEALHGRGGVATGCKNVLHLGLRPASVLIDRRGKITLGGYALTRSPSSLPGGASGPVQLRIEYLSPEQTKSTEQLGPQSDIFSLGSLFYEMVTLKPLFKESSKQRTIERIRRADVTAQMMETKTAHPGLDKILFRALSIRQDHRYRRAFVLREDLRGLMATHSFANIESDSEQFLSPFFAAEKQPSAPPILVVKDSTPEPSQTEPDLQEALVSEWTDEELTDASFEEDKMSSQKPLYPPNASSSNVGFVSGSTPKAQEPNDNTEFVAAGNTPKREHAAPPPIMETPKMDFSDLPDIPLDEDDEWNPPPKGPNKNAIIATAVIGALVLFVALPKMRDDASEQVANVAQDVVIAPPPVVEPIIEVIEEEVFVEE